MECLDVVDDDDNIVGRESRSDCHEKKLLHRSVMFFIFDGQGRILVNKRVPDKDFFVGQWSIVLGGHVSSGDTYDDAVVREALEEADISSEPFRMGFFKKRLREESENVTVYGFKTDREPNLLKEEIEFGKFMSYGEAMEKIEKEKFIPETGKLLPILRDYLQQSSL
jgi:isopentenyl-diphosphate delta-isomerase